MFYSRLCVGGITQNVLDRFRGKTLVYVVNGKKNHFCLLKLILYFCCRSQKLTKLSFQWNRAVTSDISRIAVKHCIFCQELYDRWLYALCNNILCWIAFERWILVNCLELLGVFSGYGLYHRGCSVFSRVLCSTAFPSICLLVWCLTALLAQIGCRAIEVGSISRRAGEQYKNIMQLNKINIINQDNQTLFGLGFMEMIPSPRLGFPRGVFLANHLASNDDLTSTTYRQNTYNEN